MNQLVCAVLGNSMEITHAGILMDVPTAKRLLGFRNTVLKLAKQNTTFYCLELFDSHPEWGGLDYEGNDPVEWEWDDRDIERDRVNNVEAVTVCLTKYGVLWKGTVKYSEGVQVETQELAWKDLERFAKGKNPWGEADVPEDAAVHEGSNDDDTNAQ